MDTIPSLLSCASTVPSGILSYDENRKWFVGSLIALLPDPIITSRGLRERVRLRHCFRILHERPILKVVAHVRLLKGTPISALVFKKKSRKEERDGEKQQINANKPFIGILERYKDSSTFESNPQLQSHPRKLPGDPLAIFTVLTECRLPTSTSTSPLSPQTRSFLPLVATTKSLTSVSATGSTTPMAVSPTEIPSFHGARHSLK